MLAAQYHQKRVLVTGASGFLGGHICALLERWGAIVIPVNSAKCDLRVQQQCVDFFAQQKPDIVVHCAVQGGGIGWMREHPVASGEDNLRMNINALSAAYLCDAKCFVGVSSACIYPKHAPVPYTEDGVWGGYPEPINGPYALSKRMMMDLGRAYAREHGFRCVFPILANLYGPGDHLDSARAHVVADLMLRCLKERPEQLMVWGSGQARRELLYVEDAAEGVLACVLGRAGAFYNIGTGQDVSIAELATEISRATGLNIPISFDPSRPDGQLLKVLDVSRASKELHWASRTALNSGLEQTAAWYLSALKSEAK